MHSSLLFRGLRAQRLSKCWSTFCVSVRDKSDTLLIIHFDLVTFRYMLLSSVCLFFQSPAEICRDFYKGLTSGAGRRWNRASHPRRRENRWWLENFFQMQRFTPFQQAARTENIMSRGARLNERPIGRCRKKRSGVQVLLLPPRRKFTEISCTPPLWYH